MTEAESKRENYWYADKSQKNKNWDPNSPLYGKNPARPAAPPAVAASAPTPAAPDARAVASAPAPKPAASKPEAKAETKPGADPLVEPEDEGFVKEAVALLPPRPWTKSTWSEWTEAVKAAARLHLRQAQG